MTYNGQMFVVQGISGASTIAESGTSLSKLGANASRKIQAAVVKRLYSSGNHFGASFGGGAADASLIFSVITSMFNYLAALSPVSVAANCPRFLRWAQSEDE